MSRLALITYGSQLQWAFVRGFPSMLSFESHGRVMGTLEGRWRNLIRFTDFVGGPVLSWDRTVGAGQTLSAEVLVPWNGTAIYQEEAGETVAQGLVKLGREYWLADPEPGTEKMRGHSDYFASSHWDDVLAALFSKAVPPAGTNNPAASSVSGPEAAAGGAE
ncbi:hypothetical protein [Rhodococcus sovatensis]|uniref:Uncharacterized protein n=1 Tax=Rhodococcus sovatensis TaxID=1805840 RepID=A0ABZ2PH92_9NOCA